MWIVLCERNSKVLATSQGLVELGLQLAAERIAMPTLDELLRISPKEL